VPFIELWFGDLNHPDVGISLLGENSFNNLHSQLKPNEHALFIIRTDGIESFKGSGFVRGGMYDRIQVKQDADSYTFRDLDYLNLYGIVADGAPTYNESAIFIIRSPAFSTAYPWKLSFLGNRVDRATGTRSFASFDAKYWLADELLQGGRPVVEEAAAPHIRIWKSRAIEISLFCLLLIVVSIAYAYREKLTRMSTHKTNGR
jgi:NosR/NirI family nitrous oxide reductase transcriptional regulator